MTSYQFEIEVVIDPAKIASYSSLDSVEHDIEVLLQQESQTQLTVEQTSKYDVVDPVTKTKLISFNYVTWGEVPDTYIADDLQTLADGLADEIVALSAYRSSRNPEDLLHYRLADKYAETAGNKLIYQINPLPVPAEQLNSLTLEAPVQLVITPEQATGPYGEISDRLVISAPAEIIYRNYSV